MRPRQPSRQRADAPMQASIDDHAKVLRDVYKVLRGNISYGRNTSNGLQADNLDGAFGVVADTGVANTQFTVTHNLNRIPIGFHVVRQNKAASFYDSGATWTKTQIFLKCDNANVNVTFFIF